MMMASQMNTFVEEPIVKTSVAPALSTLTKCLASWQNVRSPNQNTEEEKRPENFKAKGRHIAGGQSEKLSLAPSSTLPLFHSHLTLSVFGNAEIIALPI